jgi:hypothetical protein
MRVKISACSGSSDLQLVVDFSIIAAKMFSTPKPVFPMRE